MDKLYRVESYKIEEINGTNIIRITTMAEEYLDMSKSADASFYENVTRTFENRGKGLYISTNKDFAVRFIEVDSIPEDH